MIILSVYLVLKKMRNFQNKPLKLPRVRVLVQRVKDKNPRRNLTLAMSTPRTKLARVKKEKGKTKDEPITLVPETDIPSTSTAHGSVTGPQVTAPKVTGNNARVKTRAKSTVSKEKVVKSMKAHFVKEKSSKLAKHSEPKSVMKYVKTQFVSGFHHCSVCDSYGHKAAECLLRFTSNPKGHNPPSVRQVWVIKSN